MFLKNYQTLSTIERLFLLRSIAIIIQLVTVLTVYFGMSLQLPLLPLILVIIFESIFHIISIIIYRHRQAGNIAILCQLLADIIFLTLLLSFSGGATNAFVSLLLLPIVIAAVSLPTAYIVAISLSAIASYSTLLLTLPDHAMHHSDMTNHFIGMWANFILSVFVVSIVVGTMAHIISKREQAIAQQREEQLKNEQLLALGIASAQVTHQVATPLANIQLLYDELCEDYPDHEAVKAMALPLQQCVEQLDFFRTLATSIRENEQHYISIKTLISQFIEQAQFHFPEQKIDLLATPEQNHTIACDAMLVPALLNLLQNAIRANNDAKQDKITVAVHIKDNELHLKIKDLGQGVSTNISQEQRENLGEKLISSNSGLGMAVLLSNTTIQRLGGQLTLKDDKHQGCIAHVKLPLVTS